MLTITRFTCENLEKHCITDKANPAFSYTVESDLANTQIKTAVISMNEWQHTTTEQIAIIYTGKALDPYTEYLATLFVEDMNGNQATAQIIVETGKLQSPWQAQWITDGTYQFTEHKVSPKPMLFQKELILDKTKQLASAKIYATAIGIYNLMLNGQKVGTDYFAPGFTSYKTNLQYQTYNVTEQLLNGNTQLSAIVAGGWAVGSFVMTRKNRITANRQALLAEIHLHYTDGTTQIIATDTSWQVTCNNAYQVADFYDGETYDAQVNLATTDFHQASIETLKINPTISATYGSLTKAQEVLTPMSVSQIQDELIYDFGQNFAGVVRLKIKNALASQKIVVRHAEILQSNGTLNTSFLRTAKATATYICHAGEQVYSPTLTYMGFRYISVTGIALENIEVEGIALHSDVQQIGQFESSNPLLNQLQSNIVWSSKSNFIDIPTDCPQRDERMGWTGDIAVFAPTACFNFDMSRFLDKWLIDVKNEQLPTGGIPNTVPVQGYGFPATMPQMAIDFWGDACVLVPWAEYMARGDRRILAKFYPMMKKYVDACKFWAGLFSFGKHRYIWHTPSILHFGDWVAPDVPKMSQWQKRSKWTATASLKNTSYMVSEIAKILGHDDDATYYLAMSERVSEAYESLLTDNGYIKASFQTAYVLPIYYQMFKKETHQKAVGHLVDLVKANNYCIGTGFPGTPYILFALADNGQQEIAYKMLLNTICPSWLYQVKMGATTIWERWDGLDEDGNCPIGDDGTDMMISYNHYASGAVGDFMYKRIAGIEALEPAYKKFKVAPIIGGDLTYAKASVQTPYGIITSHWQVVNQLIQLEIKVPIGTECEVWYDNQLIAKVANGQHSFTI